MKIEFDAAKSDKNAKERGLPFDRVYDFEFSTAIFRDDLRHDYGERRIIATGYLDGRLHVLCYMPIGHLHIRIISFRKANMRERKRYEKTW